MMAIHVIVTIEYPWNPCRIDVAGIVDYLLPGSLLTLLGLQVHVPRDHSPYPFLTGPGVADGPCQIGVSPITPAGFEVAAPHIPWTVAQACRAVVCEKYNILRCLVYHIAQALLGLLQAV